MDETPRSPDVAEATANAADAQAAGRGLLGVLAHFRTQAAANDEAERRENARILKEDEEHEALEAARHTEALRDARRLSARNRKLRGAPPEPGDGEFD